MLETQPELQVVAEACDGSQAIQKTVELSPDLELPIKSGESYLNPGLYF